jgi:acyl-CoA dehydrogenase
MRLLGADALAWEASRPMDEHESAAGLGDSARPIVAQYLNARAYTIFGGTSEIQREIISRELLG